MMSMDQESLGRHITFPFVPGEPYDADDRYPFWNLPTTMDWPALPFETYNQATYPYPYHDTDVYEYPDTIPAEPLRARDETGKIVFAQDAFHRHVAIKLVRADTDEYRVLRFLSEQSLETLEQNCVVPVLELLPTEGFWFAVMPRWGDRVILPNLRRISDVVDLFRGMLKGLVFLHSNNIAHGDITVRNVLVNHFSDHRTISYSRTRGNLRQDRCLSYALFDFDFSTMFPPNADKRNCRLPYQRSWGTFDMTGDTDAGEYDYDPFAMDVGCMGKTLSNRYACLLPLFPGLAPLLDMMTTWDVRRRFTAAQALEFFELRVSELSEGQLKITIDAQLMVYLGRDPWKSLAPDVVEKWKMYKTLPKPWSRRLLCWISCRRWMCHIVPWTRWLCYQVFSSYPRRMYEWVFVKNRPLTS